MTVATSLRRAAQALPLALAASSALAHPGHHIPAQNQMGFVDALVHLLTQPDHLAMLAVAVGTAFIVVRKVRATTARLAPLKAAR